MKKTQTFYDIPINPYMPLDDNDLKNISSGKIYSLIDDISLSGQIRGKILWILSINMAGEINFDRAEGIKKIRPDGSIYYTTGRITQGAPNMYVILRNGAQQPSWCRPVGKIIFRVKEDFFDFRSSLTE